MRPLFALFLLVAQSGCTLLYGDRETGGNGGATGGNGPGSVVGGGSGGSGGGHCVPVGCADVGAVCGTITDGCGGTLTCGDCATGQTCGGAGPNRCGTGACVPKTCQQLNATCGRVSDGCAGVVDCGTCACTPTTCAAQNASCGTIDDGCGHTLDCGACPAGSWNSIGAFAYNFVAVGYGSSGLWIAGGGGNVLHSTDDTHFTEQQVQNGLSSLYVDSGGDVWAGGVDGISHKSSGATSFTLVSGSPQYVQSIHGASGSLYAVTDNLTSGIYRSTDGVLWFDATPTPAPVHLHAVFARSPADVFAAGSGGMIYHSGDAGGTWSKVSVGNTLDISALWASGSLVLGATQGRFVRSTDGGANWAESVYGSATYLGLSGTAASDVWAVGTGTTVLHSTNGGASWTQAPDVSGGVALQGIYAGATKQYAVGEFGALILRTN
jgi:photosystem II stability/assembly factor-like uncharacterized protein